MKTTIRPEKIDDIAVIEAITKRTFLHLEYSNQTEHYITNALRKSGDLIISLVAVVDDNVVGHIAFSPITISDSSTGWFGLGPVAILPQYQAKGIGSQLITEGIKQLKAINANGCILFGDPDFYSRFGFKQNGQLILRGIPQELFLSLHLTDSNPHGTIKYSDAFEARS